VSRKQNICKNISRRRQHPRNVTTAPQVHQFIIRIPKRHIFSLYQNVYSQLKWQTNKLLSRGANSRFFVLFFQNFLLRCQYTFERMLNIWISYRVEFVSYCDRVECKTRLLHSSCLVSWSHPVDADGSHLQLQPHIFSTRTQSSGKCAWYIFCTGSRVVKVSDNTNRGRPNFNFGTETGRKLSFGVVSVSVGCVAGSFGYGRISCVASALNDRNRPHVNCVDCILSSTPPNALEKEPESRVLPPAKKLNK